MQNFPACDRPIFNILPQSTAGDRASGFLERFDSPFDCVRMATLSLAWEPRRCPSASDVQSGSLDCGERSRLLRPVGDRPQRQDKGISPRIALSLRRRSNRLGWFHQLLPFYSEHSPVLPRLWLDD
ncbi:hypothetical protein CKA32_004724 [Geitlerinema sp. FC II]|nr:hypothetical protein CKA32_004724 [Geitlerinema sp. FC II]